MTTAVTRFPGVHRRTDSTTYQFGLRAPQDLLHRFPGPWAVRCSLGTSDLRQANEKAKALQAEWSAKFDAMRREDNPQRVALTPALVATIAAEVRRWVLEADDNLRDFPEGPRGLVAMQERRRLLDLAEAVEDGPLVGLLSPTGLAPGGLTIQMLQQARTEPQQAPEVDPLAGLSPVEVQAVAGFNAQADGAAAVALTGRNLRDALPLAEAVTRSLGLLADWTTPEGRAGLLEVLKAHRQATADTVRRDAGEVVDTPAQQAQPQQGAQEAAGAPLQAGQGQTSGRRMRDALEAWEGLKPRKPKTVSVFRRHVEQFATMTGDPLLSAIGHAEAERFREALQRWAVENGKTKETADNVLSSIKALAAVAAKPARAWMPLNPFAGLVVEAGGREAEQREPWTPEELPRLLASPIFTAYAVPEPDTAMSRKAGQDAAYWVPLLCLFTGARPGEVCQLWTDDLSEVNDSKGRPLLVVEFRKNAARGQSLKNPSSWRALPLHSELIRLGLRDYWQAVRDLQPEPGALFPAIPTSGDNGPGGQFGQWFGDFKKTQGFGTAKTLHSFRHTVETELGFAEVSPTLVDAITGHEGQGIGRKQYGATIRRNAVRLRPHLERLQFPGLDLPRVFKAPAWRP